MNRPETPARVRYGAAAPAGASAGVVIVGAGFGGLACAAGLAGSPVPVKVIDRRNYHLFVPLLYQVATAALSPADIAQPVRRLLARHRNIDVELGEVTAVDTETGRVMLSDGSAINYRILVLATGSEAHFFGHDEWREHARGLKTIEDARRIRADLLLAFEEAERCGDPARQQALMTIVIIGGGPTGVELAGSVMELARFALARDFRRIDPRSARIILIEAGPRLLPAFAEEISAYTRKALEQRGVVVMTGRAVEAIDAEGVIVGGERIRSETVLWGAGVRASPVGRWLGRPTEAGGRIRVAPDLSVPGLPDVYVIGDAALLPNEEGQPLPALAQVAQQQGRHLGRALAQRIKTGAPVAPFRFSDRGNTAIIGRNAAVYEYGRLRLKGRLAWLLWAIVHVYLLVGFDKRLSVTMQWLWRYATYQRGARIISSDTDTT